MNDKTSLSRYYCRRYKLNCDPLAVFKIRGGTYDHPSLHLEPLPDDEWYWLDAVPFIEEQVLYEIALGTL